MISYIPKIIGIGGAALLLTDAAKNTASHAQQHTDNDISGAMTDMYMKHQSSSVESPALEGVKNWWKKSMMDDQVYPGYLKAKNTVKSGFGEIKKYAIPLGLAAGAIFLPSVLGFGCVGLLAASGAALFAREVMGIGKEKQI